MLNGGFPFPGFENLTLPSPYYALPILSSAIFLLSIELNAADGMQVKIFRPTFSFLKDPHIPVVFLITSFGGQSRAIH